MVSPVLTTAASRCLAVASKLTCFGIRFAEMLIAQAHHSPGAFSTLLCPIPAHPQKAPDGELLPTCANMWLMIVSLVGRTTSGSSSSLPPPLVTRASSGAKPSTCSASCRVLPGAAAAGVKSSTRLGRESGQCTGCELHGPSGVTSYKRLGTSQLLEAAKQKSSLIIKK